jgi:hypothetical protein
MAVIRADSNSHNAAFAPIRSRHLMRRAFRGPAGTLFLAFLLTSCASPAATNPGGTEPAPTQSPAATETPAESATPAELIGSAVVPSPTAAPVIRKWTVTQTAAVPFATRTVKDPALAAGTTRIRTSGAAGVKTLTYELTSTNGVQTGKRLLRVTVTKAPVTKVVVVGSRAARQCDPNYSGCVPIASDVDCAGGSGNGPAYVRGPINVIGDDIYGLDRDHDGLACE